MLAMFSSGPKSRTTAALLAVFLGWAGVHKFYLGYRNVGGVHIALTAVGLMTLLATDLVSASNLVAIKIVAWVVILIGYFYVRRVHFGHTTTDIINPIRLLLLPWRLVQYTLRVVELGSRMQREDPEVRVVRRGYRIRGNRLEEDDDIHTGWRSHVGCVLTLLGLLLSLAAVALIVFLYFMVFTFIGIIAFMASIAIGVIEGILYFRKSDSAFQNEYVVNRRPWF